MFKYKRPNKRHFQQKEYKGVKFKSTYEAKIAKALEDLGCEWKYECEKFPYQLPVSYYTPDFWVKYPDGREEYIEVKGMLDSADRLKMRCVKEQHPDLNISMHFMKEFNRLDAKSPTTYLEWAEKHGFKVRFFRGGETWFNGEEEEDAV